MLFMVSFLFSLGNDLKKCSAGRTMCGMANMIGQPELLSASLEDYLEAIFRIIQDKQAARATDIGKRLQVGRSSVTGALHALAERGLINYAPYDVITLTDSGRLAAENVARRHEVLRDFFVKVLAVEADDADDAACRIEHAIDESLLKRFVAFVDQAERSPQNPVTWVADKGFCCQHGEAIGDCETCAKLALALIRKRKKASRDGS